MQAITKTCKPLPKRASHYQNVQKHLRTKRSIESQYKKLDTSPSPPKKQKQCEAEQFVVTGQCSQLTATKPTHKLLSTAQLRSDQYSTWLDHPTLILGQNSSAAPLPTHKHKRARNVLVSIHTHVLNTHTHTCAKHTHTHTHVLNTNKHTRPNSLITNRFIDSHYSHFLQFHLADSVGTTVCRKTWPLPPRTSIVET